MNSLDESILAEAVDSDPISCAIERAIGVIERRIPDAIGTLSELRAALACRITENPQIAKARVADLEGEIKLACDLLAERSQGHPEKSPGENARLRLEYALAKE